MPGIEGYHRGIRAGYRCIASMALYDLPWSGSTSQPFEPDTEQAIDA